MSIAKITLKNMNINRMNSGLNIDGSGKLTWLFFDAFLSKFYTILFHYNVISCF